MDFSKLSRSDTVKALRKLKRRATTVTLKNKGAQLALNQGFFHAYLKLAKEIHGNDIHSEVFAKD